MSDFKFDCPSCGQNIVCDTSNAGMQIPCPVCQKVLTVPKPPAPVAHMVPPGSAKLGIKKVAHGAPAPAPPPPGAANAPAKPTWGAKTAPSQPARRKGMPKWASAVILGVVVLGAAGGGYVGWTKYAEKKAAEEKKQAEEKAQQDAAAEKQRLEEAAKARALKAAWRLDVAQAEFPDRPASGKVHTVDFTVETALFQGGVLTLRQTTGSARQFVVVLPVKTVEEISGKSFSVASTDAQKQPQVTMNWKDEGAKAPGTLNFTKGYGLKLEFGDLADGKLPGKIYLSVPDPDQSYVAGHFEIAAKKIAGQPAPAGGMPAGEVRQKRPKQS